ncbi:hypothetical protein [Nocardia barduliensis]|uniref:hypothetical protein n=1 Tax=Nocardia barduliensis TaxID=2736643 RepID=UPI0015747CA1|nr:hypothetical protein [Nocardia barduliensis]
MGLWDRLFSWRRQDGDGSVHAGATRAGEWRDAPPVQRVITDVALVTAPARFESALVSRRDFSFRGPISHAVGGDAPSGVITGLATHPGVVQRRDDSATTAQRARIEPPAVETPTGPDRAVTLSNAASMVSAAGAVEVPLRRIPPDPPAPAVAASDRTFAAVQREPVTDAFEGSMPDDREPPEAPRGRDETDDTDRRGMSPITDTPARSLPSSPPRIQRQVAKEPARSRRYGLGAPLPEGEAGTNTGAMHFAQLVPEARSAAPVDRAADVQRAAEVQRPMDSRDALAGELDAPTETGQIVGLAGAVSTTPAADQVRAAHARHVVDVQRTTDAGGEGGHERPSKPLAATYEPDRAADVTGPERIAKPPTATDPTRVVSTQRAPDDPRFTLQRATESRIVPDRNSRAVASEPPVIQRRTVVDRHGAAGSHAELPAQGADIDSGGRTTASHGSDNLPTSGVEATGHSAGMRLAGTLGDTGEFMPVAASIAGPRSEPVAESHFPTAQRLIGAEDASASSAASGSAEPAHREPSAVTVTAAAQHTHISPDSRPSRTHSSVQRASGRTPLGSSIGHEPQQPSPGFAAHDHTASEPLPSDRTGIGTTSWNALSTVASASTPRSMQRMTDLVSSPRTQPGGHPMSAPASSQRTELTTSLRSGTSALQRRPALAELPRAATPHHMETPSSGGLSGNADPRVLQRASRTLGTPDLSATGGSPDAHSSTEDRTPHFPAHVAAITAFDSDERTYLQRTRTDTGDLPETSAETPATSDHAAAHPTVEPATTPPSESGATQSPATSAPASAAGVSPTDIDGLVDRLYEPIARKLKAELRLARERAGTALDLPL